MKELSLNLVKSLTPVPISPPAPLSHNKTSTSLLLHHSNHQISSLPNIVSNATLPLSPGGSTPAPTPVPVPGLESSIPRPHFLPNQQTLGSILASNLSVSVNTNINNNSNKLTTQIGSAINRKNSISSPSSSSSSSGKMTNNNNDNSTIIEDENDHYHNHNVYDDDNNDDNNNFNDSSSNYAPPANLSRVTSKKPSSQLLSKSQSPLWLPSYLHRSLSLSSVPRLHSSEAGTSSAALFTDRLLEDTYTCTVRANDCHFNIENVDFQGFQTFLHHVINSVASDSK